MHTTPTHSHTHTNTPTHTHPHTHTHTHSYTHTHTHSHTCESRILTQISVRVTCKTLHTYSKLYTYFCSYSQTFPLTTVLIEDGPFRILVLVLTWDHIILIMQVLVKHQQWYFKRLNLRLRDRHVKQPWFSPVLFTQTLAHYPTWSGEGSQHTTWSREGSQHEAGRVVNMKQGG